MDDKSVQAYIAVGSNIDPEIHIRQALHLIKSYAHITGISTFYRTASIGRPEQPPFLNGVWRIETSLPPRGLKYDCLRNIEQQLGRVRTEDKYADRTIDLDVILYADLVIDEPGLLIPDPDIRTRPFVAVPLYELGPSLILPDTREPLAAIVDRVGSEGLEPARTFTGRLRESICSI